MCSILLVIKEMQIKTSMRYYHTTIKVAKIKKARTPNVVKDIEELKLLFTVSGNVK